MKNIYQIRIIKDGHEQVFDKEIAGTVDEVHIISKAILKKELEAEMAAIERATVFRKSICHIFPLEFLLLWQVFACCELEGCYENQKTYSNRL